MDVERKVDETQETSKTEERTLPEQLNENSLPNEANDLVLWMARFPVQRIHPRPTTSVPQASKSEDVMICRTSDSVPDVFRKLIIEGFLSCPVINDKEEYVGFVDMLGLASHTLQLLSKWKESQSQQQQMESQSKNISAVKFWELPEFTNTRVVDVMEAPNWKSKNPFFPVYRDTSLLYVVELMARLGSHRVPIIDPATKKVIGITTQSMVISLIDQELEQFGPCRYIPISEMLSSLLSRIHAVQEDTIAEIAFKKMVEYNVSGLPVVNSKGELVDTISVRDLRGIGPPPGSSNFDLLYHPITVFKSKCREMFKTQTPEKPIFVTETDTFEKLIHNFHDGNIHRVFVCTLNENNNPIPKAVISQRDVLRFFIYRLGMAPPLIPATAI